VVHALTVLLSILAFAPLVAFVPMAALAALLLRVAWNMSEAENFVGIVKIAPKSDVTVLVTCFSLTLFLDMVTAISVGVVLAAFLFMRRMANLTESRFQTNSVNESDEEADSVVLPPGVVLYEIDGPLFFGAAQSAMSALHATRTDGFSVLVLNLGRVPIIDATGLAALENAIAGVLRRKKRVVVAGPLPRPRDVFDNVRLEKKYPGLTIAPTLADALRFAGEQASDATDVTARTPCAG
jgi:SulP family sulfate permease